MAVSVRRLFVFAAFDGRGEVKDSLLYYLKALSAFGDISFCADCKMDKAPFSCLGSKLIHFQAGKHGEYDFGSYKRAFFASEVSPAAYDFVYFLNDSVYGPFADIEEYLLKMEALGTDAFGLVMNSRKSGPHLHSWFLGFKPAVFASDWFRAFLQSVRKEESKVDVCLRYEVGLSDILKERRVENKALFYVNRKKIYNAPFKLCKDGLPFVKKDSFKRHNGCLEGQLYRLLKSEKGELSEIIRREHPDLCRDPFKLTLRYLSYLFGKVFGGRKADRFLLCCKKVLLGHIFNPFQFNSAKARRRRYEVYGTEVPKYLAKHYLSAALNTEFTDPVKPQGREKVFTLWLQGEENAPELIKNCFKRMREFCPDCDLIILDTDTLTHYTDLPFYIWEKYKAGKMSMAQFSDICRLDLLYRYGGYWIDSTCFLTGFIPSYIKDADFFAYMAGSKVKWNYGYIQSCFLRAVKGSNIVSAWRNMMFEFWKKENSKVDYLQLHLMFKTIVQNVPEAKEEFSRMPNIDQDSTHVLWFEKGDEPFDRAVADKVTSEVFFQKTTYNTGTVVPGSFKDCIINSNFDK